MDFGLYNLKYPARSLIRGALPYLRDVDPNAISWWMVPLGVATATAYFFAPRGHPGLYLVGVALIVLRMFLGTLDGFVAERYGKATPRGALVNRLAPEVCDVLYLTALAAARSEWHVVGITACALAWMTSFSGLLGAVVGKPTQSVGPVGQTDRLAALVLASGAAFVVERRGLNVDVVGLFLAWVVVGGVVTVLLRLHRHLQSVDGAARAS
jgi:phosphatidylglycerophosphate synthase